MTAARAQAETLANFLRDAPVGAGEPARGELAAVLDDDFNTPEALALFHDWRARGDATSLRWGLGLFGLGAIGAEPDAPVEVTELAAARARAREQRNWAEADRLRAEIEAAGWEVRDVVEAPFYRLVPRP